MKLIQPFFRGSNNQLGDLVYFQGHSSPEFMEPLEGRIKKEQLENFRREIEEKEFHLILTSAYA